MNLDLGGQDLGLAIDLMGLILGVEPLPPPLPPPLPLLYRTLLLLPERRIFTILIIQHS